MRMMANAAVSKPSALSSSSLDHHPTITTTTTTLPPLEDSTTCSTYQLTGLISHIGKHTGSGHFVAHVLVPGQPLSSSPPPQWIIFNDEKVTESEHPPVKHAYLYLFQRTDTLGASSSSSSSLLRPADGGHSTTKDDDDDAPDNNPRDNSHGQEADNNKDDDDDNRMES
ncbi:hypothetical protein ACA910_003383 [Epithemia clementina (nom. ined.)]